MVLTLYSNPLSQPGRSVIMFLKHNNIPFVGKEINIMKGEHQTEEFKSINPFGRIPAIDDNGFKLSESIAILQYLAKKHNVADHWYPRKVLQRTRIDEYLCWHHTNLRPGAALLVQTEFFIPKVTQTPVDQKKLAQRIESLENALNHLEHYFLKETKFISSDHISLADLMAICELSQLELTHKDPSVGYPRIASWMDRVKTFMGSHYDESHLVLHKVCDKNKKAKL